MKSKIELKIEKDKKVIVLNKEEAQELYDQLKDVFTTGSGGITYIPYDPKPYRPYDWNRVWYSGTTTISNKVYTKEDEVC